jgi:potassium-dependent mechanosensitive channel
MHSFVRTHSAFAFDQATPTAACIYRAIRVVLFTLLALACSEGTATGQQTSGSPSPSPSSPSPQPTPIPLGRIPLEAESTMSALQEINASVSKDRSNADLIATGLGGLASEIDARIADDTRLLAASQSLDMLFRLAGTWENFNAELSASARQLTQCATNLEEQVSRLDKSNKIWQMTLQAAKQPGVPPSVLQQVQSVAGSIEAARQATESARASVLTIQTRLSDEESRVRSALVQVQQLQGRALESVLVRDSLPIWNLDGEFGMDWPSKFARTMSSQLTASIAFTERLPFTFLSHVLVILLIAGAIQWVRQKIKKQPEKIQELDRALPIFDLPVSTAFALSILVVPSLYPQAPRMIQTVMGAVALIPTIVILRRLLDRNLYPVLNALVVMYFVGQVRLLTASLIETARIIYLGQMLGASIFLVWLVRSSHLKDATNEGDGRVLQAIRAISRIGLVVLPAALLANLSGYVNLANLLGIFFLRSIYLAAALYAAIRIAEGLIIVGLQVRPLGSLRVVRLHRPMLQRRICGLLAVLAFLFWLNLTLKFFGLRTPLISATESLLNASVSIGSLLISPGRILAFIATVWAALMVSRFVRFLLEEDVYQHLQLARGIPYAISTMLHYMILLFGFFVALGALGIDLTKITILAGAFSVGVGFGLQNVINNFVCGLILLFERPIKIGDYIEVGGNVGEVKSIGIRASVIRTADGSEIIVPNGLLISTQVTNWTFSDRQRAVEVSIAVTGASDLQHVTELLKNVAKNQAGIAKEPAPQVYVASFAAGGITTIQLRAWTDRYQDWAQVRSDLAVAANEALVREKIAIA